MKRKSNVDIDRYNLRGVDRQYILESAGRKDINIDKNYREILNRPKEYEWDGTYNICYDGVTDIRCYIDIINSETCVEFIEGESIHGMASFYPLDKVSDKSTIESIFDIVVHDEGFHKSCIESFEKNKANMIWDKLYPDEERNKKIMSAIMSVFSAYEMIEHEGTIYCSYDYDGADEKMTYEALKRDFTDDELKERSYESYAELLHCWKDDVLYDMKDIGVVDEKGNHTFYLSQEDIQYAGLEDKYKELKVETMEENSLEKEDVDEPEMEM